MGLEALTPWQWVGTVVAALLVGLSKAGFGTGAGILAVPLMATVLGPATMLPVMLLVLITGDVFTLVHYVREHAARVLAMLLPGLVLGVGAGYLALDWFLGLPGGDVWMKRLIGFLAMAFVCVQFFRMLQERRLGGEAPPYRPRAWQGVAVGAVAGVTSTLAHAGGPLIALFLLPQRLPKKVLVGTMIKYFFIGNLVKLVPYFARGLMTRQNGLLGLVLVPAVAAGTLLGVYLQGKFSDRAFRIAVYLLAFFAGLHLLVGWQPGRAEPHAGAEPAGAARPFEAFREGLEAFARSDWQAAEAAFGMAASRPGAWQQEARFNGALALYRTGRCEAAGSAFADLSQCARAAIAAPAMLNAGNCAYRSARWDEAAGWYARALGVCETHFARESGPPGGRRDVFGQVRARARFNLALALGRSTPAASAGGDAAEGRGGEPSAGPGAGPAADADGAARGHPGGPATGHAPGAGEGYRGLAAILAYVTGGDTGPGLAARGSPAVVGRKAW